MLTQINETPATAYKPFDKNRDGYAIAEGAGIVILERLQRAQKRNSNVYANIIGYGTTTDGVDRIEPATDGKELASAIRIALGDAKLNPEDIDYICLDGAATQMGDLTEAMAIKQVFNGSSEKVIASAPKAIFGNMLGATGAMDVITTVLAMEHSVVPPTINVQEKDSQCDINLCMNKAIEKEINNALVINRGRGGINSVLVIQKNN